MNYKTLYNKIVALPIGETKVIFEEGEFQIYVHRPTKPFKKYDINKNFQIFIKQGERVFRPNHLRVMIDLHLRAISKPKLKKVLLLAFDNIFYKKNPFIAIQPLEEVSFKHCLNPISVTAVLSQLFLIEQEYNYPVNKYDPTSLFYQGWIRQSIDSTRELDNIVMSICKGQPPNAKYTSRENKKNKKFNSVNSILWYID